MRNKIVGIIICKGRRIYLKGMGKIRNFALILDVDSTPHLK